MTSPARARVVFYVQHLLGIGHVYRARRICDALHASGCDLTVVTGGMPVDILRNTPFRIVQLPPLRASGADFAGLVDERGEPACEEMLRRRREMLLHLLTREPPDILITEAYPFGRRQMRHELRPVLEALRAGGHTRILSSVRDILQENRKPGRNEETLGLLNRYYDGVLVHGDAALSQLSDTFALAGQIEIPVMDTGIVAPAPPPASGRALQRKAQVIVSAGGGVVGERLLNAAALAAADPRFASYSFVLSTGPNLGEEAARALRDHLPENAQCVPFIADLPARLAEAALSVSQAGYNTVADILVARVPAVLVPFAGDGETEQSVRARMLARRGRAVHLPESGLTATDLADAMSAALRLRADTGGIDLHGAQRTAELLTRFLPVPRV